MTVRSWRRERPIKLRRGGLLQRAGGTSSLDRVRAPHRRAIAVRPLPASTRSVVPAAVSVRIRPQNAAQAGPAIGAVLAGGRGRRMGAEKSAIAVAGRSLARRAVDSVQASGLEVVLVLRPDQAVPEDVRRVKIVRDKVEDAGPLGGLHAVLRASPAEWVLAVACDQPLLEPALLRALLAERTPDVDVVLGGISTRRHPFPGVYRRTCLARIEQLLGAGERSMRALLRSVRVGYVAAETLSGCDRDLRSYLNVNTPADLERASALASATDTPAASERKLPSRSRAAARP